MTLQLLIDNHIRPKLDDNNDIRWEDTHLVNFIREVVDQLDGMINRFGLQFGKKKAELTTVGDQDYLDISALDPPLASIMHLTRQATQQRLTHEDEDVWETILTTGELRHYLWYEDQLFFKGTPSSAEVLVLWYWPDLDTSAYVVGTDTPWDGKMDFIIAQHVILLCQNVDEMDISMDDRFTKSLEKSIVRKFGGLFPRVRKGRGWMKTGHVNYRVGT